MLRQEPPCSQGPRPCWAGRREEPVPRGPGDGGQPAAWGRAVWQRRRCQERAALGERVLGQAAGRGEQTRGGEMPARPGAGTAVCALNSESNSLWPARRPSGLREDRWAPHPSGTRPGPGGRWGPCSRAGTGRAWRPSGGWCCTGLPRGRAGSGTGPPGGTGGLRAAGGGFSGPGLPWRPPPGPPPAPVRPGGQRQEKAPTRSMQVAPGAQVAAAQSSRLSSQRAPPQPLPHTQWKPPAAFRQVPPWAQRGPRPGSHSSTSSEQSGPAGAEGGGLGGLGAWGGAGPMGGAGLAAVGRRGWPLALARELGAGTHLSRPRGRGRCRRPVRPGTCRRSGTGARRSRPGPPRSAGL